MNILSRLRAWLRPYPDDAEMQAAMVRRCKWYEYIRRKERYLSRCAPWLTMDQIYLQNTLRRALKKLKENGA